MKLKIQKQKVYKEIMKKNNGEQFINSNLLADLK